MKKIKLSANKLNAATDPPGSESKLCELSNVYEIAATRSDRRTMTEEWADDDVLVLDYKDGLEWIVRVDELEEPFIKAKTRGADKEISTGVSLSNQRGGGQVGLRLIKRFVSKKLLGTKKKDIVKFLGTTIDELIAPNPGVYHFTKDFNLIPIDDQPLDTSGKYLLLIHGFVSSTKNSFKHLEEDLNKVMWSEFRSQYNRRILVYDHRTISESPIQNTIKLLQDLPKDIEIDILSFSRGGMVADMLSLCSAMKTKTLSTKEYGLKKDFKKEVDSLIKIAKKKAITVHRVTRVSCPANGTQLLSKRLDYFLNGTLSAIGLAIGGKGNFIYDRFKDFVLDCAKARADINTFPGIAALVPGSEFLKFTNSCGIKPEDELLVIEGDSEVGKNIWRSIGIILANLIHWEANDLVVNTESMRFGLKRATGVQTIRTESNDITHFRYLLNPISRVGIFNAITWDSKRELKGFSKFSFDQLNEQLSDDRKPLFRGERSEETKDPAPDLITELFYPDQIKTNDRYEDEINISLYHADLKFALHPVLLGHFAGEEIISAEAALDSQLKGRLSDRYLAGNYPRMKESSIVALTPKKLHKGGIVIGLGEVVNFTEAELRQAVKNGILSYAMELRDNILPYHESFDKSSISSLFIGTQHGSLSIYESITAILFGIAEANNKINELNQSRPDNPDRKLYPITKVQFVDIYEHLVREALQRLKEIAEHNYHLEITVPDRITNGHGRKKKNQFYEGNENYHNIITEIKPNPDNKHLTSIRFMSNSVKAKVEGVTEFFSKDLIDKIVANFSYYNIQKDNITGLLYNLLIPKRIKYELKNRPNIQWKMDKDSAEYPWEMLHDKYTDKDPMFINSGLIRQLITSADFPYEKVVRRNEALIIGDPIYTDMNALPGALEEATYVNDLIRIQDGWKANFLANKGLIEIVNALQGKYRLLHVAGHGVYDQEKQVGGIVVEDTILDSHFFKSLPFIPEFAFINCCYSGDINAGFEKKYSQRYKLAASLGIQLIEQGVNAVIITGWAVDDDAAMIFAQEFYNSFFNGRSFGDAVKVARRAIYKKFSNSITWGAYQCYGNPHYKINRNSGSRTKEEYTNEDEVLTDIFNLSSETINWEDEKILSIKTGLKEIHKKAIQYKLETPKVLEELALVHFEIDDIDGAYNMFKTMLAKDRAAYSVRSLEQYFNLLMKLELKQYQEINDEYELNEEDLESYIANFKNLISLAANQERYALMGSAYKRYALIDKSNRMKHLKNMTNFYWKAVEEQYSVYPLTNHYQGLYLSKMEQALDRKEDILRELNGIKSKLETKPDNNFWTEIEEINILTTEILYRQNASKISEEITTKYSAKFKRLGTMKTLRSEIEQFEFLAAMLIAELRRGAKLAKAYQAVASVKRARTKETKTRAAKAIIQKKIKAIKKIIENLESFREDQNKEENE